MSSFGLKNSATTNSGSELSDKKAILLLSFWDKVCDKSNFSRTSSNNSELPNES